MCVCVCARARVCVWHSMICPKIKETTSNHDATVSKGSHHLRISRKLMPGQWREEGREEGNGGMIPLRCVCYWILYVGSEWDVWVWYVAVCVCVFCESGYSINFGRNDSIYLYTIYTTKRFLMERSWWTCLCSLSQASLASSCPA